jgi:hypothetical protein
MSRTTMMLIACLGFSLIAQPSASAAGSGYSTLEVNQQALQKRRDFDWRRWQKFNLAGQSCRQKHGNFVCLSADATQRLIW